MAGESKGGHLISAYEQLAISAASLDVAFFAAVYNPKSKKAEVFQAGRTWKRVLFSSIISCVVDVVFSFEETAMNTEKVG